jgi:S1-C subfamily serine protease
MRSMLLLLLGAVTLFALQEAGAMRELATEPWPGIGTGHLSALAPAFEDFAARLPLLRDTHSGHFADRDAREPLGLKTARDHHPYLSQAQAQPSQPISPVVQVAAFKGNQFLQAGSGFILHLEGRILTNSHVIHNVSAASGRLCQDIPTDVSADRVVILVTEKGENEAAVPRYLAAVDKDRPDLDLALLQINARILTTF